MTMSRGEAINVWLVDDSANFRELLAAMLEDEGGIKCVRQFSSAEAVLAALEKESGPDIILLDNRMTGMDGVDAVASIVELTTATHVLMLTTLSDTLVKAKALNAGASDFLLKSFQIGEIADRIRQVHASPRRALLPAPCGTADVGVFRPERRASEVGVGVESRQKRPPDIGPRKGASETSQSCLTRGVNFFRGWWGQSFGQRGKDVKPFVPLETPR